MTLGACVAGTFDRFRDDPGTRATCTETMRRLRETAGDRLPVAALTPEIYEQTMARWDSGAANTGNKHLSVSSAVLRPAHPSVTALSRLRLTPGR